MSDFDDKMDDLKEFDDSIDDACLKEDDMDDVEDDADHDADK